MGYNRYTVNGVAVIGEVLINSTFFMAIAAVTGLKVEPGGY
ncbi:MAG: hypothetical protein R2772_06120 [Chitinophagales bacterium]